ncbi:MAG: hypothetical protein RIS47_2050, partial [Bacteroidota bacterium]
MMVKNIRLWILALLCVWTIAAMAQTDAESAKSVVKIKTVVLATEGGKEVKKLGTASGWCWKEPTLVVTALHAVAGVSTIDVYVNGSESCTATVERVLKEADLALLRLSKDLGLKPLTVDNVEPNSNKEYYVWGFPHAVYTIQGDEIRFSRSLEAAPTLNSILTGNKLKFELRQQGYPLPEARILRIGSTIQPGHSGAPIFTSDGKVIGIADGGLRGGTARINWAMPAGLYVSKLFTSTDAYPTAASMQVTLYNSSTTVDADATESEENQQIVAVAKQESVVNGSVAVHQTWTTDFDQIYDNADEDEQVEIDSFLEQLGLDLTDTEYDIYEDYKSGATFALPKGAQMKVENGWYYAHNKSA